MNVLVMEGASFLKEIRTPQTWEDMKAQLVFTQDHLPPIITGTLQVEFDIDPYLSEVTGPDIENHLCILTRQRKHDPQHLY